MLAKMTSNYNGGPLNQAHGNFRQIDREKADNFSNNLQQNFQSTKTYYLSIKSYQE